VTEQRPFSDERVQAVFDGYPPEIRDALLGLRDLIFEAAEGIDQVGGLTETLKWGQPSYLPERARVGTTVRIDARKKPHPGYAMYVHCQTSLADDFRELYPGLFSFEGNRAVLFDDGDIPRDALKHCIGLALTYHLKRRGPS
jgi:hypothetical protein